MIGTIKSAISSYTGIGQTKKAEENTSVQQQSTVKENTGTTDAGEVKGESFSASDGKPSRDPAGSKDFVSQQSQFSAKVTGATAERETGPLDKNKTIDITGNSPEARQNRVALLRSTGQRNPTSEAAKNGEHTCGASSIVNSLVLDSKTPEAAKKNAESIEKTYGQLKGKDGKDLPPMNDAEKKALQDFKDGKLSPKDMENLQQVMYRITQNTPGRFSSESAEKSGLTKSTNASDMATAVNLLRDNGGYGGGSKVTFHNTNAGGNLHWTSTVDGLHTDTDPAIGGNRSVVTGAPPDGPSGFKKGDDGFNSSVSFEGNSDVKLNTNSNEYTVKRNETSSYDPTTGDMVISDGKGNTRKEHVQ